MTRTMIKFAADLRRKLGEEAGDAFVEAVGGMERDFEGGLQEVNALVARLSRVTDLKVPPPPTESPRVA